MPISVSTGIGPGAQGLGIFDFPLSLVGAGLTALWRPDDGAVTVVGSAITSLADQSGSGNVATQPGLSTLRPALTTRLGKPVISYDGGDRLQIAGPVLSSNDNWSMAMIYECSSLDATRALLSLASSSGGAIYALNDGVAKRCIRCPGVGVTSDGDAVMTPEAVIVSREAGQFKLYLRSGEFAFDVPGIAMGTPSGTSAKGALTPAGTFPFQGFEWMSLVYQGGTSGYLDATQRASFFAYSLTAFAI